MAVYAPIWKDTYYTSNEDELIYNIVLDGEVIYKGRAFSAPDAQTLKINVSKICQDYLSNSLPDFRNLSGGTFVDTNSFKTFYLYDDGGTLLETYYYLYCWDYLTDFSGSVTSLSHPVNGHYNSQIKVFSTQFSGTSVTTTLTEGNGDWCGSGALYYLNRSGGWDSFLIEGISKKSETYEKYTYNKSFNNNTPDFEQGTYHNQITVSWVLNTGYLSDEESETLAYHLFPSNAVYFHNFQDDTIVPVVITDTKTEYKTYKNQGRKMVKYVININESQKKQLL